MSAISLKSITGITSITTPAGVDNVFTVHTNDTTERFRVDSTGNLNIAGIVTVTKDLDVDGHTNLDNVSIAGITTSAGIVQAVQFKLLDNAKAKYGTGEDLEIYHNATNSLIQNGTGSLQIITTTGDLFLRGQDNITFNTAGNNERLRITSNGKVGIGTDNPTENLDIISATNSQILRIWSKGSSNNSTLMLRTGDSGGAFIKFGDNSDNDIGQIHYSNSQEAMRFVVNTQERLRIKSNGNVGINSTDPGTKLNVVGTIQAYDSATGFVSITPTGSIELRRGNGGFIDFSTAASEDFDCRIKQEGDGLAFTTGGNGSTSEALRLTGSGDVLIGGHTQGGQDSSKLSVYDSSSNIGIIQVHCGTSSTNELAGIAFGQGGSSSTARAKSAIAAVGSGTYGRTDLCFYVDGTADNNPVSAADERLRITSDGKMGLGSGITSPIADFEIYKSSGISSCVVRGPRALLAIMGDSDNNGADESDASLMFTSDSHTNLTSPLSAHGFEIALINDEPGSGLRFHSGTSNLERLRITPTGKIGINISTPGTLLHQHETSSAANYHKFTNGSTGAAGGDGAYVGLDASEQFIMWTQETGKIRFGVGNAERAYINNSGHLGIVDGNLIVENGHGIDFSSTGDSAGNQGSSELLDDYEEGTWTPAFRAGNNSTACPTNVSEAKYTRVGRLVTATAYFTLSSYASGTTGGDTRIVGLPYQNIGDHGGVFINYWWGLKQNVNFMAGTVQGSTSEILIRATTSAAVGTANIDFDNTFQAGDSLILTATYFTS